MCTPSSRARSSPNSPASTRSDSRSRDGPRSRSTASTCSRCPAPPCVVSARFDEADSPQAPGDLFWESASQEKRAVLDLVAGRSYALHIQFRSPSALGGDGRGGLRLGGHRSIPPDEGIADAVAAARRADAVVCVVGLTAEWEGEGFDRPHMGLSPRVDDLVRAVLEANPQTIVVVQSGTPIALPWVDQAATLLQAWYGGGELGHGLADVLFGLVNPAARLSLSWPRRLEDTPTAHFGGARAFPGVDGKAHYDEKLAVGYRWYDLDTAPDPLFAFGHGLSFTTFEVELADALPAQIGSDGSLSFAVEIRNTGARAGRHVIQVRAMPSSCLI